MDRAKKLIVLLDLSESGQDKTNLSWAGFVARGNHATSITFLHVRSGDEVPEEIRKNYPEAFDSMESAQQKLQDYVSAHFKAPADTAIDYVVLDGAITTQILAYVADKDFDALFVGRHVAGENRIKLAEHLCQKIPFTVFVAPQGSERETVQEILVPIDFSGHSMDAVEVAAHYAKLIGLKKIDCVHVFDIPVGYSKTGKTKEEFAEILQKNAEVEFKRFVTERFSNKPEIAEVSVTCHYKVSDHAALGILKAAKELSSDLIFVGARGRSSLAGLLLGSVSSHIIAESHVPVIAVKRKGTGLNFLQAILKELGL